MSNRYAGLAQAAQLASQEPSSLVQARLRPCRRWLGRGVLLDYAEHLDLVLGPVPTAALAAAGDVSRKDQWVIDQLGGGGCASVRSGDVVQVARPSMIEFAGRVGRLDAADDAERGAARRDVLCARQPVADPKLNGVCQVGDHSSLIGANQHTTRKSAVVVAWLVGAHKREVGARLQEEAERGTLVAPRGGVVVVGHDPDGQGLAVGGQPIGVGAP